MARQTRALHVVERFEVAGGENPGTQAVAAAKGKAIDVNDVRDGLRLDAEAGEHLLQETRGHDVAVHVAEDASCERRSAEMVGGFAAAIIHDDGLSQQPGDENCRQRGQQEREVRR
jgi:hypothetical protein